MPPSLFDFLLLLFYRTDHTDSHRFKIQMKISVKICEICVIFHFRLVNCADSFSSHGFHGFSQI